MASDVIYSKIRGVTFENRQAIIRKYLHKGTHLVAKRDPKNDHGAEAIELRVRRLKWLLIPSEIQVGFIGHDLAVELAPYLDGGGALSVRVAELTGGDTGESVGVNIAVRKTPGSRAQAWLVPAVGIGATLLCLAGVSENSSGLAALAAIVGVGAMVYWKWIQ